MSDQAQERDDQELRDTQEVREAPLGQILLAIGILVALVGVAVWGIISLAPDDAPDKRDPSFIDSIFANVVVIAAARVVLLAGAVVLLFAGVYIVISTAVRMGRGQWLRRAGPFETDLAEQERRLGEAEDFFDDWLNAMEQNEDLVNRLAQRDEQVEQLLRDREVLLEALAEGDEP